MPRPVRRNPSDPDYPHGTNAGYVGGCKASDPCPATPSCSAAHATTARQRRAHVRVENHLTPSEGRYGTFVHRRLVKTLAVATEQQVAAYTGLDLDTLAFWADPTAPHPHIAPERIAAPLDEAWAFLLHGSDVRDPAFPHGDRRSYTQGRCRCQKCRTASTRGKKRWDAGQRTDRSYVTDPGLTEHLLALRDAAGGWKPLGRIVGISHDVLIHVAKRGKKGNHRVIRSTQQKLRNHTPESVRDAGLLPGSKVGSGPTLLRIGQLQALGYPLWWINTRLGRHRQTTYGHAAGGHIAAGVAWAVEELAREVGDRPASPEDGIAEWLSRRTAASARRRGYYPPVFYDEDGSLDYRSIPGHKWSKADDRAAQDFPLAYAVARGDKGASELVALGLAPYREKVERIRDALGISTLFDQETKEASIAPQSRSRAAWIRSLLDAYEDGTRGPVEVALTIGLRDVTQMPKDHPEVVAWKAIQPAVQLLAWVMFTQARLAALTARVNATARPDYYRRAA